MDAPFAFLWHGGPRIHRFVPLSANPYPVRQLGRNAAARAWLETHLGFDPHRFDEWLGGLALVAPDPVCSALHVFPSARAEDGRETLTMQLVPRRSAERGIADLSDLAIHLAERRIDGWSTVQAITLGAGGYGTISNPQSWGQVGYALVCPKRGLLRFVEPQSWIAQVGVGMNIVNSTVVVEVPSGGRRKPGKMVPVQRFFKGGEIVVGQALNDIVRHRLITMREHRKARERRAQAPQRVFGIARDKVGVSEEEIKEKQNEAENFVGGLVAAAQRRVIFVDVRLQMFLDNVGGAGTEALARLGLEFKRLSSGVAIVAA
ncbi:MAG: hypothetical protein WAM77_28365 [Xanthobacteraceae bacterium]